MTPLMPAPQPSQAPALPGPGRSAPHSTPGGGSFAAALEQEQAATGPGTNGDEALPLDAVAKPELADEAVPPDALAAFQPLPLQQPAPPPWPPAGLAGLAFSAAGDADPASPGPTLSASMPLAMGTQGAPGGPAAGLAMPGAMAEAAEVLRAGADGDGNPPAAFALPALAAPASTPAPEAPPMLEAPLPAPEVRARDFSERFGAQLQWMANEAIGHARIRVSPQELGPVEVMLRLDGERISAEFISPHAETRQALEHGLPRLRDLLGEHGFQLAHAGVGQESADGQDGSGPAHSPGRGSGDAGEPDAGGQAPVAISNRLLDAYA